MRADRDKRAAILTAEGQRQSAILTAEGNKQSAILNAEGDREAQILRAQADRESAILTAQGEGQAIQTVFQAIHDGQPDQSLLAYQYLQMMPKIAEGDANKVWVVPSRDRQGARGPRLGDARGRRASRRHRGAPGRASTWAGVEPDASARTAAAERPPTTRSQDAIAAAQRRVPSATTRTAASEPTADPASRPGRRGERRRPVSPAEIVAILLAGVAAGTINTVVGSGTLITFPTLLAFGVPPVTANVSNNVGLVPGLGLGRGRLPARARRPAAPAGAAGHRLAARRDRWGACCCWCCPRRAFDAIVPVLIAARRACWSLLQPPHQPPGRAHARRRAAVRRPARRLLGLARGRCRRRVRRVLRRRPGRAADGDPRDRRRARPCSATTPLKNVLAVLVNRVAA